MVKRWEGSMYLKKIYQLIMLRRLRELPYMILNRKLKHLSDESKYKLFMKNKESHLKSVKSELISSIAIIIMVYRDSTYIELENTIQSINEQSRYLPARVLICSYGSDIKNEKLSECIEGLCNNDKFFYHLLYNHSLVEKFEYYTFIRCGDVISSQFLCAMEQEIFEKESQIIYSDEDEIDINTGARLHPYLKPEWSPDTLLDFNYIGNSIVISSQLDVNNGEVLKLRAAELLEFYASKDSYPIWLYRHILQVTQKANHISHLPKVLYHVTISKNSLDINRLMKNEYQDYDCKLKKSVLYTILAIKNEYIIQSSMKANIVSSSQSRLGHIVYELQNNILASIVIPTKNNNTIFEQCVESIIQRTKEIKYEIIAVDNGSNEQSFKRYKSYCHKNSIRYLYHNAKFNFSCMCNMGANYARGDVLLFLNDDTEIINEEWLGRLCGQAMQKHTGLVGAKLLYPDKNRIQHCGIINLKNNPTHSFYQMEDHCYHYHNLNNAVINCFAVTGACLAVEKSKFDIIGGWSEKFPIAYNDVELGIRAMKSGYYNVVRNDVIILHHESISRGNDFTYSKIMRLRRERIKLWKMHKDFLGKDPYYNPNLNPYSIDYDIDYIHKCNEKELLC